MTISTESFTRLLNAAVGLSTEERTAFEQLAKAAQNQPQDVPPERPLLVNQKTAAYLLGVHRHTVAELVNEGAIRPIEVLPNTFRYRRTDIEEFAQTGYVKHKHRRKAA